MAENDIEALAVELEHVMTMHPVGTYISVDPRLAQAILAALRSTTAEPVAPTAEAVLRDLVADLETWDADLLEYFRLLPEVKEFRRLLNSPPRKQDAPTDSAAKDAEIAAYREALERIRDNYEKREGGLLFASEVARQALANRGEAGSLAKERGE